MGTDIGNRVTSRMGKTTVLRHIAERKLAIPGNIDVLYCEQGRTALGCFLL